jgi:hypothetical protein
MTTLEQIKRLKVAGYEFNPACDLVYNPDGHLMLRRLYNPAFIHECQPCPSEKELMDWLAKNCRWMYLRYNKTTGINWEFDCEKTQSLIEHTDLTECLVQAVIAVMKGAKC